MNFTNSNQRKLFLYGIIINLVVWSMPCLHAQNFGTWTWKKGSSVPGGAAVYGTMGIEAPGNNPPPMYSPVGFTDLQGRFWVYGGSLLTTIPTPFMMWRYNPATNNWAWMNGANTIGTPAVYGTQGIAAPSNTPGPRQHASGWTDLNGNFWLFGNYYQGITNNDLWKYDVSTNQWTWMKGTSVSGDPGSYGTQGVPSMSNCPPARGASSTWTDNNGDLWLFGGYVPNGNNTSFDDMWRYSVSTNMWTWMGGSSGPNNVNPNHGVQGVSAASNTPGGRWTDSRWKDTDGNFWLFSGMAGTFNSAYADMWKYSPTTNLWTWMGGNNTPFFADSFSVKCSPNGGKPAAADLNTVCWVDDCNRLWQFGGEGRNPVSVGYTNTLWFFDPTSKKFNWQGGSTAYLQPGSFGTQGIPSTTNYPASTMGGTGFKDNQGNFWMFGGCIPPLSLGGPAEINTMWKYTPDLSCAAPGNVAPPVAGINASSAGQCTPLQYNFQAVIAEPNLSFEWNFGDSTTTSDTSINQNPSYTFAQPGIYTIKLIVTRNSGCAGGSDTATFQLNLSDASPLQSFISASACGSYTAPWGVVYNQSGTYVDTLTALNGCDSLVTLNLTIKEIPSAAVTSTPSQCGLGNGTASVTASGGTPPYSYNWLPLGENTNTIDSLVSGGYIAVVTDIKGCSTQATATVGLSGGNEIQVAVSDFTITEGDSVKIEAQGATEFAWTPPDGLSCINCASPNASPLQDVVYTVTGTDVYGCKSSALVKIRVETRCGDVFFPTIFSPDRQGPEKNEMLCAYGNCIKELTYEVFNRWGQRVFRTNALNECWDGKVNGIAADAGAYVFRANYTLTDGTFKETYGTLTLVR